MVKGLLIDIKGFKVGEQMPMLNTGSFHNKNCVTKVTYANYVTGAIFVFCYL